MLNKAAIIISRLDSKRFPKKALEPLGNRMLVEWPITLIKENTNFEVILATTNRKVDNELEEVAKKNNIKCFRGKTDDIAKRIIDCCKYFNIDYFARINGDSPFVIKDLLVEGFNKIERKEIDFVTNLIPREFPYGVSVEIFEFKLYSKYYKYFNTFEKEHATTYFYKNINQFNPYCIRYTRGNDHDVRFVIDYKEDKARIVEVIKKIKEPIENINLNQLIEIYRKI